MKNKSLKTAALALLMGATSLMQAQTASRTADYNTIPQPRNIRLTGGGQFVLNAANFDQSIRTRVDASPRRWSADRNPDEAYELRVGRDGIEIVGATEAGVFYGMQTLRKAIRLDATTDTMTYVLPYVEIHDSPVFAYRGVHLDCSRHFFPLEFVKRYIDIAALHGCNRFHWHLTDDQGWRFEVKRYPRLTEVGSHRDNTIIGHNLPMTDDTPHDGFYTQEECREIVRYAAERHIEVMPEVDLPGHMVAALASYPELGCTGGPYQTWNMWGVSDEVLCAGNPATVEFVRGVLAELIDVFPSRLIHLGGDECPKVRWEQCPRCQARIQELGLKDQPGRKAEEQLQSWFMQEAERFLQEHGRQMIGWDEILDGGVSPTASVMSWRGLQGGIAAARSGHQVVMTPIEYCYLNFYQSARRDAEPFSFDGFVPLSHAYRIPVVPEELNEEESRYILGCQANLWAEYIPSPQQAEWMLLPRLAALSEAMWMPAAARDYDQFLGRLPWLTAYYQELGYRCSDKRE